LDQGELIYVSPNNFEHNEVRDKLYIPMREFVRQHRLGIVTADTLFKLGTGLVRAPDIAFIPAERFDMMNPKEYLEAVPALVVEVLSPSNKPLDMTRKSHQYRAAGVHTVLVLDPERREADLIDAAGVRTVRTAEMLEIQAVLPGFFIPLSALFE
ncbi:MAG: Uma2 family endonuclease, partial [Terriglobia bacterium]